VTRGLFDGLGEKFCTPRLGTAWGKRGEYQIKTRNSCLSYPVSYKHRSPTYEDQGNQKQLKECSMKKDKGPLTPETGKYGGKFLNQEEDEGNLSKWRNRFDLRGILERYGGDYMEQSSCCSLSKWLCEHLTTQRKGDRGHDLSLLSGNIMTVSSASSLKT